MIPPLRPTSSSTLFTSLAALALAALPSYAEQRAPLDTDARTNGDDMAEALAPLHTGANASIVRIVDWKGKLTITGTCVGREGYFITKASELLRPEKARLVLPDGRMCGIREVRRDSTFDLVLLQALERGAVVAAEPAATATVTYGQWLTSPAQGGKKFCIGVLSAQKRQIKGFGAALGVRMDDDQPMKNGGVRITGIAEDGPAAMAGLVENDVLLSVAGEQVAKYDRVHEIMTTHQPGEEVEVHFRRDGKERKVSVRLASRTKVLSNWEGEDFANGGVSMRTDNFSKVLQHDLPLAPEDMGGPLLDLEGKLLGINIARVDRVTTFALPTEVFWPAVRGWMEADRHPPRAVVAESTVPPAVTREAAPQPESRGPRATLHQAR